MSYLIGVESAEDMKAVLAAVLHRACTDVDAESVETVWRDVVGPLHFTAARWKAKAVERQGKLVEQQSALSSIRDILHTQDENARLRAEAHAAREVRGS